MPDYSNDPVMKQIAAARAGIGTTVGNATGEIDRREAAANTSVNNYLPSLSGIYAGLGGAANDPSMRILRASQEATAPLVQMGFTDLFQRQRGGLDQARLLEEGNLANQEASFLSTRESEDRDRQFKAEESRKDRAQSAAQARAAQRDPIADYAAKLGIDKQLGIGDFAPVAMSKTQQSANDIYKGFNSKDVSNDRGAFLAYLDNPNDQNDEYSQLTNSGDWKGLQHVVESAKAQRGQTDQFQKDLIGLAKAQKDPRLGSLLLSVYGRPDDAGRFNEFLANLYAGGV